MQNFLDLNNQETKRKLREAFKRLDFSPGGRGFLTNYPPDVVAVVNGRMVTKTDILNNKRHRQSLQLQARRSTDTPIIKPCFVWVFYNDPKIYPFYSGWYLYIRTLRRDYPIGFKRQNLKFRVPIMRLFPCGLLPMIENFEVWLQKFARIYHRPTSKRPTNQGMVIARAVVSPLAELLELRKSGADRRKGTV